MSKQRHLAGSVDPLRCRVLGIITVLACATITMLFASAVYADTPPVPGSAGIDTALPPTASAVTVAGRGQFSGVQITVNQTKNLVNQAISVTWTGAVPTDATRTSFNGQFFDDYFQIMECWGADDGTVPADPGPPPQQCEFGGQQEGQSSAQPSEQGGGAWEANSRSVTASFPPGSSPPSWVYVDTTQDQAWWMPFRAVDGTVVEASADLAAQGLGSGSSGNGQQFWLNPYFSYDTTNEDAFGFTHSDGTGSELFTVDTGLEAPGLGCGQESETLANGKAATPDCWLVVVPRSTPAMENAPGDLGDAVNTSPLAPTAWANRISIPLQFNPVGTSCPLGADETPIVGSETASPAANNWAPALCANSTRPPINYEALSDDQARQQLTAGQAGMAVVSQPADPSTDGSDTPITYAPLTLSGAVIAFNIDRQPADNEPAAEEPFLGIRVAHLDLTPRLVAKLLTQSYQDQFLDLTGFNLVYGASYPPSGYGWLQHNPMNLFQDPDFLQYNPEFKLLGGEATGYDSGLIVEEPDSDAANELWQWVLADPEARAWLAGQPDAWGMNVNPNYSTNANLNPAGAPFGNPVPQNFPKSDPYCYQNPLDLVAGGTPARPLCMQDVFPYASSMQSAALETREASDGAKTNFVGGTNADSAFGPLGPQSPSQALVMSVTDAASAAQYGLQTAGLSAAGDDGANRQFVFPDTTGLEAGVAVMRPGSIGGVLRPDESSPGAYPLTMLTYAALSPTTLTPSQRQDYGAFLEYAAGPGQILGTAFGDLPAGYVPLPSDLQAETVAAAKAVLAYRPPVIATTTTTTPPATTTSTSSVASATPTNVIAPPATSTPAAAFAPTTSAPAATTPPSTEVAPLSVARVATPAAAMTPVGTTRGVWAGGVRYLLPITLGTGIVAAFSARWLEIWRRRKRPHPAPPGMTTEGSSSG